MAFDADAARLLAADEDVVLQHKIADVFEADAMLIKRLIVLSGDTIQHLGGVESTCYAASPALSFQQPSQQDGKNLVGIDEVTVFIYGTETIRVTIRHQASLTFLCDNRLLQSTNVGLDWFRVDAGEQRVMFGTDLHKVDAKRTE